MTRRIALAILLTVWAVLVAGCVVAYATVRWALIQQLDQSLVNKASALPELARVRPGMATRPAPVDDSPQVDRYVIKAANGVTVSPAAGGMVLSQVESLGGSFSELADGTPMRNVVVRGVARAPEGGGGI